MNTRKQGAWGVGRAIAYFTRLGWAVSLPIADTQRYDLIVDNGDRLYRVEVKATRYKVKERYICGLRTLGGNQSWSGVTKKFSCEDSDYLFVTTEEGDSYLIPSSIIDGIAQLYLGPKYNQYKLPQDARWTGGSL